MASSHIKKTQTCKKEGFKCNHSISKHQEADRHQNLRLKQAEGALTTILS